MEPTIVDPGHGYVQALTADQVEALVETMYLVAFADGEFQDAERAHFTRSVQTLTEGRMKPESFEHVVERMAERLLSGSRDSLIASLKERLASAELRQIALILAMDIAAADGVLHDEERSTIDALGTAFGIAPEVRLELFEGPPQSPTDSAPALL